MTDTGVLGAIYNWLPFKVQKGYADTAPASNNIAMHDFANRKDDLRPTVQSRSQPTLNSAALSPDQIACMKERPWQYVGYPLFTRYLASSREAVILRRFDQLHARVLLKMQDDIVRKEEELARIDQDHSDIMNPGSLHINGSFREDAGQGRREPKAALVRRSKLLDGLKSEIRHYDQMILNYRSLRSDPEPSEQYIDGVRKYLRRCGYSNKPGKEEHGPIFNNEADYIFKDGDLLELVPVTKAPLRKWMERWTTFMLNPLFRTRPKGTRLYQDFFDESEPKYLSDTRIEGFITMVTLAIGLALLIVPLQLLNRIEKNTTKLNVICGLIAAFLLTMGVVMPVRPWETLGATAAYAAVLMVFMQIPINQDN